MPTEDTLVANDLQDADESVSSRSDPSWVKPSKAMARRHLERLSLNPDSDRATFQIFDDNKQRANAERAALKAAGKPETDPRAKTVHGTLQECWGVLAAANSDGCGVFITVNKTRGTRRRRRTLSTDERSSSRLTMAYRINSL
jgi:hypothetical protein